jgi:DNA (cytosine-5)-methyltransferase 1
MKINISTDCSGIETPIMALDMYNIKYKKGLNINHVFSSEIDKKCIEFIKTNFNPSDIHYDLTKRNNDEYIKKIPQIDLYIAGFPCTPFSKLGNLKGFDHKQGNVFFHIYDFILKASPNVFILENVKNLKGVDGGKTFKTIIKMLEDLNIYNIYYDVLNTMNYGLPQNRERLYIVGIKKTVQQNRVFRFPPKPTKLKKTLKNLISRSKKHKKTPLKGRYLANKYGLIAKYKIDLEKIRKMDDIRIYNLQPNHERISFIKKGVSPCLTSNDSRFFYIMNQERYLLEDEAKKLQGIPTNKYDFSMMSRNKLFYVVGNSMSVNVLVEIYKQIFKITNIK